MLDHSELYRELEMNYGRIKDIICKIKFSQNSLEALVEEFSEILNSRRKQSTVECVASLLSLLEERCVLDCINIEPLFKVNDKSNDEVLNTCISCHQKLLRRWYSEGSKVETSYEPEVLQSCTSLRVEIPPPVKEVLSQGIGYSWRDFARSLHLLEYEIDNIDETYSEDSERVKWVLLAFEEKACFLTYKDTLLKGLVTIRRIDLKDRVDQMFSEISTLA